MHGLWIVRVSALRRPKTWRVRVAMIEDQFIELIDPLLKAANSVLEDGEEFREPPLAVLRYYRRSVRLNRVPIIGKAQSVVAVVRQPVDIDGSKAGLRTVPDPAGDGRQRPVSALARTGDRLDRAGPDARADRTGRRCDAARGAGRQASADAGRAVRLDPSQPGSGSDGAWPSTPAPTTSSPSPAVWPTPSASSFVATCHSSKAENGSSGSVHPLRRAGVVPVERNLERLPPGLDAGRRIDMPSQSPL